MSLLQRILRRRANELAIDADIEAHIAEKTDDLVESGMSKEEARAKARREFGNLTLLRETSHDEWSWGEIERLWSDLRYAARSMRRNPGFALTVLFTLALGIGANAAIFSLLHAVILRTLPVPDAEQLRLLRPIRDGDDLEPIFSYPVLGEMQSKVSGKASLAGYSSSLQVNVRGVGGGSSEVNQQANVQLVSGNFFQVLRVNAQAGRVLTVADDRASGTFPAVLSDAYWSEHFGRDPAIIGHVVSLNGTPATIAGVAAAGFFGLEPGSRPGYWLPVSAQHDLRYLRNFWNSNGDASKTFLTQPQIRGLGFVARIRDARSLPFIETALNQVYGQDMKREGHGWDKQSAAELMRTKVRLDAGDKGLGNLRQKFAEPLIVLMSAVGMVLLIACINLASLALARVAARGKEIAVRCSIGASRGRIMSQLLSETVLLSVAGGLISIPVAFAGSHVLLRWASNGDPMPLSLGIDAPLLLFVGLAALFVGLMLGLLPAYYALNFPLADALKAHAAAVKGMRLPWGRTLIAAQVMFSLVLLTGAVLFVQTLRNYTHVPLGYLPQRVLAVQIDPLGAHYSAEQLPSIYDRVLSRVRQIPGIESAALASCELSVGCKGISGIRIAGHPAPAGVDDQRIQENTVSPGYFATVGMRMVTGRAFDWHERAKSPILAVVNVAAAEKYFGGKNAIGQHFGYGGDERRYEIIGVVADARINDVHEPPTPLAYFSLAQNPSFVSSLEVRTQAGPVSIESAIRGAIKEADSNMPVQRVRPLTAEVDNNLLRERLLARLASGFGFLALALACLGVYGVLSYTIARRTSEIGIRLALGAESGKVRWMVIREALIVIAIGLVLGIPAVLALTRLIQKLLYGLSAADPMSLAFGIGSLLLAGIAAAMLPAWRASRVDPMVALRHE